MDHTEHRHFSSDSHDDEALRASSADPLLPVQQPMAGPGEEPGTEGSLPHVRPTGSAIVSTVAIAVLGFVATAAFIHVLIRRPLYLHADTRSEKLVLLNAWKGKAYSASFGSSHVHDGFDPRVFDSELEGTALQTHSINLAVEGGSQTEQRRRFRVLLRKVAWFCWSLAPERTLVRPTWCIHALSIFTTWLLCALSIHWLLLLCRVSNGGGESALPLLPLSNTI